MYQGINDRKQYAVKLRLTKDSLYDHRQVLLDAQLQGWNHAFIPC